MSPRLCRTLVALVLLLLALLTLPLFPRCSRGPASAAPTAVASPAPAATTGSVPAVATNPAAEVLTPATLTASPVVDAGAAFRVGWTGPNNPGDYVTIVRLDAPPASYGSYRETREGTSLELAAPLDAGNWELRYVTARSKTVLGRCPVAVSSVAASLAAAPEVIAGAKFSVTWQGPKNRGDYITVVPKDTPDGQYKNYTDAAKGSPLELTAPMATGAAEIRYMTGAQARVLARRDITVMPAAVVLKVAAEAAAGAPVTIAWSGPKNAGDYITIVPKTTPDGRYGSYADTTKGSPLSVAAPSRSGLAEVRYVSGQGSVVLARTEIEIR